LQDAVSCRLELFLGFIAVSLIVLNVFFAKMRRFAIWKRAQMNHAHRHPDFYFLAHIAYLVRTRVNAWVI